ncbi:RING-H2 finger protein ATL47-like [Canna indica]|uniref:RING-type E3 ubiquitin transferase n=1 Tax=Canna indica TaxID=4628 RepID=A0AAQ3Q543_9LILI|nr:RING-H2 finger protein ATL47-like [Canna indica]
MMVVTPPRPWLLSHTNNKNGASSLPCPHLNSFSRDSLPFQPSQPSQSSPSSRISPVVLFTIVILAVIFFVAGLLHLLVRFLIRKRPSSSVSSSPSRRRAAAELPRSGTLQRQLQQLFHLHDSGLDQAFIDALPLFLYSEILGSKEPFDCAVCLCEFAPDDKLRLLPVCGHAFHLGCIDTWLLSNSTCPLCRGVILVQGLAIENPVFALDDSRGEEEEEEEEFSADPEAEGNGRTFHVRLGKFKKLNNGDTVGDINDEDAIRELGETSSSNLDARRCFSMGSYQYVVADANLQVALSGSTINEGRRNHGNAVRNEMLKGKRLGFGSRDESLSVSKIWQWSDNKGKFPVSSVDAAAAWDGGFPWIRPNVEDT